MTEDEEEQEWYEDFGAQPPSDERIEEMLEKARTEGDVDMRRLLKHHQALRHVSNVLLDLVPSDADEETVRLARFIIRGEKASRNHRARAAQPGSLDDVANDDEIPEIAAEITFLTPEEGGRREPVDLSAGLYRPHLVVGDPNQRQAIVRDGYVIDEEYLGVQFKPTSGRCEPGVTHSVILQHMYYPRVNYGGLVPGATFTVREGGRGVAFGHVLERSEHAVQCQSVTRLSGS